uniref:Centrosomal protein 57 n=1 Tax=Sphaeramia orbicularis TaxID=375764 RepID=A0A673AWP4_9TELE
MISGLGVYLSTFCSAHLFLHSIIATVSYWISVSCCGYYSLFNCTFLQEPAPSVVVSDSMSLPSYKDYPTHRPFINTLVHHTPTTRTHQSYGSSSPSKAFPETNSAAILSALRNLQDKIRRLELEKAHGELKCFSIPLHLGFILSQSYVCSCNYTVLVTHLAAAESRCMKLERQLDHMRRMLRNAKADRSSLLKQQVYSLDHSKLDRLEQEYLRLTHTQNNAEIKIRDLELKLQEEEHQRKLVQDKANQLQAGLETNRILLQSVSPCLSSRQSKDKKSSSKQMSYTEPHYKLSLRDVPFVAGTSVGCSHSVRANVQSVLSLLKQHQPHLCNSRVLSKNPNSPETGSRSHSSSSSSSSTSEEELSDLLQALQEELRLMSLEQDELMRQVDDSVSEQERKELQREQQRLLLKMERKGEQISNLYKHKAQVRIRLHTVKQMLKPGERSKRNLRLLRDMKALQTSLRT